MAFMRPAAEFGDWILVDTSHGTEIVPADLVKEPTAESLADYIEGEFYSAEVKRGTWCARLSAPGYMDCTPWQGPYPTEAEALADLAATYGDEADSDEGVEQ